MYNRKNRYSQQQTYNKMKISIDGNIGGGKSTLLTKLCQELRLPVFLEPIQDWNEWLTLFYKDNARWGMSFNLSVLMSFSKWCNNNFLALYERSPLANRYIFSEIQCDQGTMNTLEIELYNKIYDELSWIPDVVIYIKTTPEVTQERIKIRGRECENTVPLEYLKAVHDKYEKLYGTTSQLDEKYSGKKHCKIITIDGNRPFDEVYIDVKASVQNYI